MTRQFIVALSIVSTVLIANNGYSQTNRGKKDTTERADKSVKKLDSTNTKTPVVPLEDHNAPMPNALDKGKKDSVKKKDRGVKE